MKNFPLVMLLVLCTGFIIALNLSYLRKVVMHSDLHNVRGDDGPPPTQRLSVSLKAQRGDKGKISKAVDAAIPVEPKPKAEIDLKAGHRVASLDCKQYGGPENPEEMVYWRDIPKDAEFVSPFANYGKSPKYLTFEPDEGGWNNIRMSMETATVLAHAMGRTLVLPPEQRMYLLWNDKNHKNNRFTFKDFFHFDSIAEEHPSVEVISMEEFMKREAITGHLKHRFTGKVTFPPNNATSWDGHREKGRPFWMWLRNATQPPIWSFDQCVVGFASEAGPAGVERLQSLRSHIKEKGNRISDYVGNPVAVDAPMHERFMEVIGTRKGLCLYDDKLQNEKVVHFMGDNDSGARLLVHFYAFLFFEDYHHDLWTKRFVRDHLRYIDEIQCAAARVVQAVRQKAIENGDPDGTFDSFHIRRGGTFSLNDNVVRLSHQLIISLAVDFQYKETRISADQIYENTKDVLVENSTVFIATDEKDSTFFDPLRKHYNLLFLNDFKHLFEDLNSNYMGMLDQRIASRGRTFIGAYYSTFTGKLLPWEFLR